MRLSRLGAPFTCLVVCEPTVRRCLTVVERYERNTDSFEVNLAPLGNAGAADVFRSTSRPCIAAWRRSDVMVRYGYPNLPDVGENSRAQGLALAVSQGAEAADLELDTFGESGRPRGRAGGVEGLSKEPEAVRRQSEMARQIVSSGAEVVMSCHLRRPIGSREALKVAREARRRGGQLVSIVSPTRGRRDLFSLLACGFALSRGAKMPFALSGVGTGSGSDALLSLLAGSSWVYCRPEGGHAYGGQPALEEASAFIGSLGLTELGSANR